MLITQDQQSVTFPVIVTLLSDTTTSSAQMPILLAMVITLIPLLLQVSERLTGTDNGKSKSGVTLSDVHDPHIIWRDLNVMSLQIVIA